jgi:NADH:ubiquinone oxidoreductase subunit 4 (subunit M)
MYLTFELVTLPVVLMIYKEGSQPEKLLAINYMLAYTGFASAAFIYVVVAVDFDIMLSGLTRCILIGMFLAKSPLYLLHRWLPKAHVEAPTAASILLAGVLLKVGLYGLFKIIVYIKAGIVWATYLSVIGLCLSPLSALLRADSKQFMAYSSISHINLLVHGLGFFGLYFSRGRYLVCLSHGYISSILFLIVGEIYQKRILRLIYYVGGIQFTSRLALFLHALVLLGNAGVPPSLSFWGELMVVTSLIRSEF